MLFIQSNGVHAGKLVHGYPSRSSAVPFLSSPHLSDPQPHLEKSTCWLPVTFLGSTGDPMAQATTVIGAHDRAHGRSRGGRGGDRRTRASQLLRRKPSREFVYSCETWSPASVRKGVYDQSPLTIPQRGGLEATSQLPARNAWSKPIQTIATSSLLLVIFLYRLF